MSSATVLGKGSILVETDAKKVKPDLDKAKEEVTKFTDFFKSGAMLGIGFEIGAKIVEGITEAAKKGIETLMDLAKEVPERMESLAKIGETSISFGIPIEQFSKLEGVARGTGQELDTLSMQIIKVNEAIDNAGEGGLVGAKAIKAFERLKLSWQELEKLRPDERLKAVKDAMRALNEEGGDGIRAGAGIFGDKQLKNLLVELGKSKEEIEQLGEKFKKTPEQIALAQASAHQFTLATATLNGAWNRVKDAIAPVALGVANLVADITNKLIPSGDVMKSTFVAAFREMVELGGGLADLLKGIVSIIAAPIAGLSTLVAYMGKLAGWGDGPFKALMSFNKWAVSNLDGTNSWRGQAKKLFDDLDKSVSEAAKKAGEELRKDRPPDPFEHDEKKEKDKKEKDLKMLIDPLKGLIKGSEEAARAETKWATKGMEGFLKHQDDGKEYQKKTIQINGKMVEVLQSIQRTMETIDVGVAN